jgi:hypothetical protein
MSKGLEFQFCSDWKDWEELDMFALQFYDAVLLPHVAAVVGVDVAPCMTVDCSNSVVSFYLEDGSSKDFRITAQLVVDSE